MLYNLWIRHSLHQSVRTYDRLSLYVLYMYEYEYIQNILPNMHHWVGTLVWCLTLLPVYSLSSKVASLLVL